MSLKGTWFMSSHERHRSARSDVSGRIAKRAKRASVRLARREWADVLEGVSELLETPRGAALLDGRFVSRTLRVLA